MVVVVFAVVGLVAFLGFVAYLNGGSSPFRHVDTPPSWPDGGAPGDEWYRRRGQ